MDKLFFDTTYINFQDTLIRLLIFLAISGIVLFLVYFMLTKLLFRKRNDRREINLRIIFLWAIFSYLILFNTYLFFLFYRNGIDSMNFGSWHFYLGIIAQITIYLGLFVLFFIKRHSLKKIINEKSTN